MGRLGLGMGVSASLQIIPRPVGRLGLRLGSEPPRRRLVMVRTPSRVEGLSPGVFSVGVLYPGELSPGGGGYLLESSNPVVTDIIVTRAVSAELG